MKQIEFYLDFLSPFAYLAFEKLPEALAGISHQVVYKPVLLGALLRQHGQRGPAEIPGKREWTFRHVMWLAQHHGVPLQMPAQHPFAPLPLLRLALGCGPGPQPNRYVCETLFHHVWRGGGADANDAARLAALANALAPRRDPTGDEVKGALRQLTEQAVAAGVFGVPTFVVDGRLFWGLDALPMLRDYLNGHDWFQSDDWGGAARQPSA
jgi:2-hydroxychromene-2-carboxylate isomerase